MILAIKRLRQAGIKRVSRTKGPRALARKRPVGLEHAACPHEEARPLDLLREQKDVCKLYRRWEQCCKGSQAGMDDPDARNYGEAYVEALDHGKHGNGYDMSVLLRN